MISIGIAGATGKMGLHLVRLTLNEKDLRLAAALEYDSHPSLGMDIGIAHGAGETGVPLTSDLPEGVDVLIDFSTPEGTARHIDLCVRRGTAMVIGTTGIESLMPKIESAAGQIAILASPNMSVGMNLVFAEAARIARSLGIDYDIEIVEAHHRFKKDAPSGSALRIASEIAEATGRSLDSDAVYGRHGKPLDRKPGELGIHAIRGGDIVGEHTIIYATLGERVELKHVAQSRETFAHGAIRAARFLHGKKPGLYAMADVLKK